MYNENDNENQNTQNSFQDETPLQENCEEQQTNDDNVVDCSAQQNNVTEINCEQVPDQTRIEVSDNQTPDEQYSGGIGYTKTDNNNVSNGYAWNAKESAVKKHKKTRASRSGLRVFSMTLLTVFVLSFVTMTVMVASYFSKGGSITGKSKTVASDTSAKPSTSASSYAAIVTADDAGTELTIPQIAKKCSPSAVGIVCDVETSYNYGFGFYSQSQKGQAVGSGFILNEDGYIITNHHVIENAEKITVVLSDKTEIEAKLIGSDELSDIAVIKITPPDGVTLVPMEVGNSDNLVVGEEVVAIGCPAGIEYMGTVTNGIVSAINRDIEIKDNYGRTQKTMTLIQTNATINKGNSGGPLINSKGQVIGINTLKLTSEFEGIGFSIPMNGAMAIINQLIDYGKVVERTEEDFAYGSGMIGITGSAVSEDEAKYYSIPQGVLVVQIDKNSSAAQAGLRRGDIITAYNGNAVKTVDDINKYKEKNKAGEEVKISVYRDGDDGSNGKTFEIKFKLDAQK